MSQLPPNFALRTAFRLNPNLVVWVRGSDLEWFPCSAPDDSYFDIAGYEFALTESPSIEPPSSPPNGPETEP